MTDRVYHYDCSLEVSGGGRGVEVYVFDRNPFAGEVMITAREEASWGSQRASFTMTAEEATTLKEFLIHKGY